MATRTVAERNRPGHADGASAVALAAAECAKYADGDDADPDEADDHSGDGRCVGTPSAVGVGCAGGPSKANVSARATSVTSIGVSRSSIPASSPPRCRRPTSWTPPTVCAGMSLGVTQMTPLTDVRCCGGSSAARAATASPSASTSRSHR